MSSSERVALDKEETEETLGEAIPVRPCSAKVGTDTVNHTHIDMVSLVRPSSSGISP